MENFIKAETARRITDEVREQKMSFLSIVEDINDLIKEQAKIGGDYTSVKVTEDKADAVRKYLEFNGFRVEPFKVDSMGIKNNAKYFRIHW